MAASLRGNERYQGPYAPERPDLGPDIGEVDRGRDEGGDGEDPGDRDAAIDDRTEADNRGHAEDDQPQRLGLLARGGKRLRRTGYRVNERPRLHDEGAQGECEEQV